MESILNFIRKIFFITPGQNENQITYVLILICCAVISRYSSLISDTVWLLLWQIIYSIMLIIFIRTVIQRSLIVDISPLWIALFFIITLSALIIMTLGIFLKIEPMVSIAVWGIAMPFSVIFSIVVWFIHSKVEREKSEHIEQINNDEYKKIPSWYLFLISIILTGIIIAMDGNGSGMGFLFIPIVLLMWVPVYLVSELIRHLRIYLEQRKQK